MALKKTDRNRFKAPVEEGDLVQIHPDYPKCGGCFLVVTEVKVGSCLGYIMLLDGEIRHAKNPIPYEAIQRIGVPECVENMGIPKRCT